MCLLALTPNDYLALVESYRSGSTYSAVATLRAAEVDEVKAALDGPELPDVELEIAAILLHTEVAVEVVEKERVHLLEAERLLEGLKDMAFVRSWRLWIARHFQTLMRPWSAIPHLEKARALFPDDLVLAIQAGSAYEVAGWLGSDKAVALAEDTFRSVLEREPGHAEAHLRLGRVFELSGKPEQAIEEIEKSLSLTDDVRLLLPGNLLLGDLYEERGDSALALRHFEAAVVVDPLCQPAAMALGFALRRSGRPERARQIVESFFAEGAVPAERDGWWLYMKGDPDALAAQFRELREKVR